MIPKQTTATFLKIGNKREERRNLSAQGQRTVACTRNARSPLPFMMLKSSFCFEWVCFSVPVAALCSHVQPSGHPAPCCPQLNAEAAPLCLLLFSLLLKYRPLFLRLRLNAERCRLSTEPFTRTLTDLWHVINCRWSPKMIFLDWNLPLKGGIYVFKYSIYVQQCSTLERKSDASWTDSISRGQQTSKHAVCSRLVKRCDLMRSLSCPRNELAPERPWCSGMECMCLKTE